MLTAVSGILHMKNSSTHIYFSHKQLRNQNTTKFNEHCITGKSLKHFQVDIFPGLDHPRRLE